LTPEEQKSEHYIIGETCPHCIGSEVSS